MSLKKWALPTFFVVLNSNKKMTFEERKKEIVNKVTHLVKPLAEYNDIELVLVEFVKGPRGNILRLVIDKDGGVTLDDCTRISRVVSDLLDVHDPVPGSYSLEVSSPGINRPLVKKDDYNKFSGEKVLIKLAEPLEGRKKFKGVLRGIINDDVVIESSGQKFYLPYSLIIKARLDIL